MILFFILAMQIFILSWLVRAFKHALFWVYLWQLKEYHIGRFVDYFRTYKGRKSLLNFFSITKIVFLVLILLSSNYFSYYAPLILFLYIAELFIFVKNVLLRELKIPKFTVKAIFLTAVSFLVIVAYVFSALELLEAAQWQTFFAKVLLFDILAPLIVSGTILIFQPLFFLMRLSVLEKARGRIKQNKNLIVIGITGSYGKTSTKEFLKTILSLKFNVLATPKHKNSEMGIAQTILNDLKYNHDVFIVEMGSYAKGGIKLLCDIVKPKMGLVTGVNEQHLATFGSMKNLLSAEGGEELAKSLPKNGLLIVNGDNKYCLGLYKSIQKGKIPILAKTYSLKGDKIDSDIWTEDIEVKKNKISFIVISKEKARAKEIVHFEVKVLGEHNIQNLLGSILIAKELGMSLSEIAEACKNIKPEQAGISLHKGINGINLVDSSYSSNPDGVMADLDYFKIFKSKKAIIMPCLIELGGKSSEVHQKIGKKIAEVCDMAIITTREKFDDIKTGAIMNGMKEDKIIFSENPKEIFNTITTFCKEGDAVLLEGRVPRELIKLLSK